MRKKNFCAIGESANHSRDSLHATVFIRVLRWARIPIVARLSPSKRQSEDGMLRSTAPESQAGNNCS